jgi:hypothetical protein
MFLVPTECDSLGNVCCRVVGGLTVADLEHRHLSGGVTKTAQLMLVRELAVLESMLVARAAAGQVAAPSELHRVLVNTAMRQLADFLTDVACSHLDVA